MNKKIVTEIPIACSLSSDDLADRQVAWKKLLRTSLLARVRVPGGLRLSFGPDSGPELNALVDLERDCCPWITFVMNGESVTMTAPGDGEEVLLGMFSAV